MDITKLPWWIFAGLGCVFIGFYNFFLAATKNILPSNLGLSAKHIYICLTIVIAGFISFFTLIAYYYMQPKLFKTVINKHLLPHSYSVIVPSILMYMYLLFDTLALAGGGGIAMVIININMLITIALGVTFLGDKINAKIIGTGLVALVGFLYTAYQSNMLNK